MRHGFSLAGESVVSARPWVGAVCRPDSNSLYFSMQNYTGRDWPRPYNSGDVQEILLADISTGPPNMNHHALLRNNGSRWPVFVAGDEM